MCLLTHINTDNLRMPLTFLNNYQEKNNNSLVFCEENKQFKYTKMR